MSTVAIGDIHGNFLALQDLLSKLLPTLSSTDILVFLGDYIDRGPQTRACVDRIIQLKREAHFPVATLLGNHEDWMLKTLRSPRSHSWILGMEAFQTITSYSPHVAATLRREAEHAGMALLTEKKQLPYETFFSLLPQDHLTFFQSLELFRRTDEVICVHAGIRLDGGPLDDCDAESFVWGPDDFPERYGGNEPVVYGHWDNSIEDETGWPLPRVMSNQTYGIDTISKGVLTAMRFPEGEVLQSNRYL